MAGLLLHEQRIPPGLDQVRDIGAAQRVEIQALIQAERVPVLAQPPVQRARPIRGPRSDGHSAADSPADGISGRASATHWSSTSGTHSHTVSTLRCFGGDPFIALPNRTWHTPYSPNSGACGFGPKSAVSSIAASVRRSPNP